jgi:hypothetical protein
MEYNQNEYNASQYDLTQFSQTCTEALSEADVLTKSAISVRVDSQATADAISDGATLAAFLETVNIYQHAYTQLAYNNSRYNWNMYNRRFDEDEILLRAMKVLTESQSSSDVITAFSSFKALADSLSYSAALFLQPSPVLDEFVYLSESFRIEVANKAFMDIIRMNDWLQIKKVFVEYWHD